MVDTKIFGFLILVASLIPDHAVETEIRPSARSALKVGMSTVRCDSLKVYKTLRTRKVDSSFSCVGTTCVWTPIMKKDSSISVSYRLTYTQHSTIKLEFDFYATENLPYRIELVPVNPLAGFKIDSITGDTLTTPGLGKSISVTANSEGNADFDGNLRFRISLAGDSVYGRNINDMPFPVGEPGPPVFDTGASFDSLAASASGKWILIASRNTYSEDSAAATNWSESGLILDTMIIDSDSISIFPRGAVHGAATEKIPLFIFGYSGRLAINLGERAAGYPDFAISDCLLFITHAAAGGRFSYDEAYRKEGCTDIFSEIPVTISGTGSRRITPTLPGKHWPVNILGRKIQVRRSPRPGTLLGLRP